jgi:hypothetical protein
VHFGIGNLSKIDKIEILWPSGKDQVLQDVTANQVLQVKEPER